MKFTAHVCFIRSLFMGWIFTIVNQNCPTLPVFFLLHAHYIRSLLCRSMDVLFKNLKQVLQLTWHGNEVLRWLITGLFSGLLQSGRSTFIIFITYFFMTTGYSVNWWLFSDSITNQVMRKSNFNHMWSQLN